MFLLPEVDGLRPAYMPGLLLRLGPEDTWNERKKRPLYSTVHTSQVILYRLLMGRTYTQSRA